MWASKNPDGDAAVLNQRQRDRVLTASKKPFRAVDGIQRPVALARHAAPAVDCLEHSRRIDPRLGTAHDLDNLRLDVSRRGTAAAS